MIQSDFRKQVEENLSKANANELEMAEQIMTKVIKPTILRLSEKGITHTYLYFEKCGIGLYKDLNMMNINLGSFERDPFISFLVFNNLQFIAIKDKDIDITFYVSDSRYDISDITADDKTITCFGSPYAESKKYLKIKASIKEIKK